MMYLQLTDSVSGKVLTFSFDTKEETHQNLNLQVPFLTLDQLLSAI